MAATVTFKGKTLTLQSKLPQEGDVAQDCELVGSNLEPVKLSTYKGRPLLLLTVPSLDTPVCSQETHRFNQEMDKFKGVLSAVCVSMDLPFAQARWCGAQGVKNVVTLSDFRKRELGQKYGLLIPELGLLARAIFLIDAAMKIKMVHLVKEITQEPDYKEILNQVTQLVALPK